MDRGDSADKSRHVGGCVSGLANDGQGPRTAALGSSASTVSSLVGSGLHYGDGGGPQARQRRRVAFQLDEPSDDDVARDQVPHTCGRKGRCLHHVTAVPPGIRHRSQRCPSADGSGGGATGSSNLGSHDGDGVSPTAWRKADVAALREFASQHYEHLSRVATGLGYKVVAQTPTASSTTATTAAHSTGPRPTPHADLRPPAEGEDGFLMSHRHAMGEERERRQQRPAADSLRSEGHRPPVGSNGEDVPVEVENALFLLDTAQGSGMGCGSSSHDQQRELASPSTSGTRASSGAAPCPTGSVELPTAPQPPAVPSSPAPAPPPFTDFLAVPRSSSCGTRHVLHPSRQRRNSSSVLRSGTISAAPGVPAAFDPWPGLFTAPHNNNSSNSNSGASSCGTSATDEGATIAVPFLGDSLFTHRDGSGGGGGGHHRVSGTTHGGSTMSTRSPGLAAGPLGLLGASTTAPEALRTGGLFTPPSPASGDSGLTGAAPDAFSVAALGESLATTATRAETAATSTATTPVSAASIGMWSPLSPHTVSPSVSPVFPPMLWMNSFAPHTQSSVTSADAVAGWTNASAAVVADAPLALPPSLRSPHSDNGLFSTTDAVNDPPYIRANTQEIDRGDSEAPPAAGSAASVALSAGLAAVTPENLVRVNAAAASWLPSPSSVQPRTRD